MNHDYTHCLDFTKRCPKKCFRAQLEMDLLNNARDYAGMCFSYTHFKGSNECCLNSGRGITVFLDKENYVVNICVDEDLWNNKSKEELLTAIEKEIAVAFRKEGAEE